MPKKLPEALDLGISTEIARHIDGIGIQELHQILGTAISRRSLQRRLSDLADLKLIRRHGQGRRLRYLPVSTYPSPTAYPTMATSLAEPTPDTYMPISPDSEEIRAYVRRPIQGRRPVGYDREFLERYLPNQSQYLPVSIREHLRHIGQSPLPAGIKHQAGTYARDMLGRLLIDLSWASSRLEGNTYSQLDTLNLIEYGKEAQGKDHREAQMILNHKAAIEFLVEQAEDVGFTPFTFFNLHALLSENLLTDPNENGRLRHRIVEISGTVFHPLSIPQHIQDYFHLMLNKAALIDDPFEQAFFIMVHVPYLQPFIDVNKRVSRLGANISLIKHNLCPLSFIDVPEQAYIEGKLGVYELQRVELLRDVFVWAYERSCQRYVAIRETVAEPDPLRLRYREVLITLVSDVVRGLHAPNEINLRNMAATLVPAEHLDAITAMALADLIGMHEGNISRFRLRLAEYRAWQSLPCSSSRPVINPPRTISPKN